MAMAWVGVGFLKSRAVQTWKQVQFLPTAFNKHVPSNGLVRLPSRQHTSRRTVALWRAFRKDRREGF